MLRIPRSSQLLHPGIRTEDRYATPVIRTRYEPLTRTTRICCAYPGPTNCLYTHPDNRGRCATLCPSSFPLIQLARLAARSRPASLVLTQSDTENAARSRTDFPPTHSSGQDRCATPNLHHSYSLSRVPGRCATWLDFPPTHSAGSGPLRDPGQLPSLRSDCV